jgi:MSHA biogenesis protein MshJ
MMAQWRKYAARIDALTQRERAMVFAALLACVWFAANGLVLGPLQKKQQALRARISQQTSNMAGIDAEIAHKLQAFQADPDAGTRARLAEVKAEAARLDDSLRAMQKGLVPPERMGALLDSILRANGHLQLVAMKTLPVGALTDMAAATDKQQGGAAPKPAPAAAAAKPAAPAPSASSLLYRHGVEITVRGNYLDIVNYMSALESMPTQLFWGRAVLEVEQYPTSRLSLTVYTLSLDQKWMKL